MHKIVSAITIFLLAGIASLYAQVGSPYSQFGLGDSENRGYEQSKAMGGIGVGLRSGIYLNSINPASLTSIDSLTVIYSLGVNTGFNNIETETDKLTNTDTKFGYFAIGFKGSEKWASSFGLSPVSIVNYTLKYSEENEENGNIDYYMNGSGGLNKIYWSNAFQVNPKLSLGVDLAYVFGTISKTATIVFTEDWANADNTKVNRERQLSDLKVRLGLQYELEIDKDKKFILGAVYENKKRVNSKKSIYGGTAYSGPEIDDSYYSDIYYGELKAVSVDTSNIKEKIALPHTYGLGFTYLHKKTLVVGLDIYQELWKNLYDDKSNATFKNMLSFRGGLAYTPDFNSINKYYKRVQYRLGGHYTFTNLEIKGTQIKDYGMSFGFGLPLRNTKTTFNMAFEFGRRGTLEQNLLLETYGIISLNLSLSDIWFVKRKFK